MERMQELDIQERELRRKLGAVNQEKRVENMRKIRAATRAAMTEDELKAESEKDAHFHAALSSEAGKIVLDDFREKLPVVHDMIFERVARHSEVLEKVPEVEAANQRVKNAAKRQAIATGDATDE